MLLSCFRLASVVLTSWVSLRDTRKWKEILYIKLNFNSYSFNCQCGVNPHMTPWKLWKMFRHFHLRTWNFLQNSIHNFVIWLIHSWEITSQSEIFNIFFKKGSKRSKRLWYLKRKKCCILWTKMQGIKYHSKNISSTIYKKKKKDKSVDLQKIT